MIRKKLTDDKNKGEVIDDDYPVHYDYLYIIGDYVYRSDVHGTIRNLRRDIYEVYQNKEEALGEARKFKLSYL